MTDLVATIHSIEAWLKEDEHNVVFVHCSDGKVRRTCMYILFRRKRSRSLPMRAHFWSVLAVSAYACHVCARTHVCTHAYALVQAFLHSCMHMRFRSCVHGLVRLVLAWELVCACVSARARSVHVCLRVCWCECVPVPECVHAASESGQLAGRFSAGSVHRRCAPALLRNLTVITMLRGDADGTSEY